MPDPLAMDSKLAAIFGNRSLSKAYATLSLFKLGPGAGLGAGISDGACAARFELDDGLSPLFPYFNAVADPPRYYEKPVYIKFQLSGRLCATFPVYDDQGNLLRTVSLDIDTACLRRKIDRKEAHIQVLEARLADFENNRTAALGEANSQLPTPLTRREIQVLRRMARGATNKEISKALCISEHTVKSHVIHIFNKLGVNDRAQASAWGALNGFP